MNKNVFIMIGAIIVTGIGIAAAFYFGLRQVKASPTTTSRYVYETQKVESKSADSVGNSTANYPSPLPTGRVQLTDGGNAAIGDINAPLYMVEFTDLQCTLCADFNNKYFAQLKEDYIDTGKLRFAVKDYPLFGHLNAPSAAYYAQCIHDVDGTDDYFAFIQRLFMQQIDWANMSSPVDYFDNVANSLDLSLKRIDSCFENQDSKANVDADKLEGDSLGVNGTPIFFLNGRVLVGSPPTYDDLKAVIEEELNF